jgi:mannose-6-phosphate isomerase
MPASTSSRTPICSRSAQWDDPRVWERRLSSPNLSGIEAFAFEPRRVDKPWGYELIWAHADAYVGKLLSVRAGHELSLQFHRQKDESWYVLEGRAQLEFAAAGEKATESGVVTPGAAFRITPGTVHRVRALEDTVIVEVSTPHLDDVVRLEDSYGRAGTSEP